MQLLNRLKKEGKLVEAVSKTAMSKALKKDPFLGSIFKLCTEEGALINALSAYHPESIEAWQMDLMKALVQAKESQRITDQILRISLLRLLNKDEEIQNLFSAFAENIDDLLENLSVLE